MLHLKETSRVQCVLYNEETLKQFNAPSARKQKTNQHVESFQPHFLHKEAILLLPFYNSGMFETRRTFQKRHKVYALPKIEGKDINRPARTTKTCLASFPLVVASHQIPLLSCHGASTVRGEHLCRDSRPLGSQTHYQASFISWHSMSRAMWQLSATFANSQSCKKREILSPDPCNPMTCNASLHTFLFTRAT